MKKLLALFLVIFGTIGAGCPNAPPGPGPQPDPPGPLDSTKCAAACAKLAELHCPEGDPVRYDDGSVVTCEKFCVDTLKQGVNLNPVCVMSITKCSDLETKCQVGSPR